MNIRCLIFRSFVSNVVARRARGAGKLGSVGNS
jgi:hypothetical protein